MPKWHHRLADCGDYMTTNFDRCLFEPSANAHNHGTGVSVVQGTAGVVDKTLRQSVSTAGYPRATGVGMATRVHSTFVRAALRDGRASAGACCVIAQSESSTHDDTGERSFRPEGRQVGAVVGIECVPPLMPIHRWAVRI
jgi:hypothetical protein